MSSATRIALPKSEFELRKKVVNYGKCCDQVVIGRTVEITVLLAALLTRSNVLMLGVPGEGKTFLGRTVQDNLKGVETFFKALSPETDMDEVFGAPMYEEMQRGKIRRNLVGTLGTAHVALIDEIGKGNTALHQGLFSVLNERKFINGTEEVELPLFTVFATSNEVRDDSAGFLSRFHLKMQCDRLTPQQRLDLLNRRDSGKRLTIPEQYRLDLEDIQKAQASVRKMRLSESLCQSLVNLGEVLLMHIDIDSRMLEMCVDLVKAYAWLSYAAEPNLDHLKICTFALWEHPEQQRYVSEAINTLLRS